MKVITALRKEIEYPIYVDDEDFPLLNRHTWHLLPSSTNRMYAYAPIHLGQGDRKMMPMTHMIMGSTWCVDHRDNNPLNNQKENLRVATRQQNNWNTAKILVRGGKETTSKYKGVSKIKNAKKKQWKAQIKHNGKILILGSFKTEDEAAIAYNDTALRLHGEFAWVNPITLPGDARSE